MQGQLLNQEMINELRRAHCMATNKCDADRIKAIYSLYKINLKSTTPNEMLWVYLRLLPKDPGTLESL